MNSANYGYTPDQIKEMQAAFRKNDITKWISLETSADMPYEKARIYCKAKNILFHYWFCNLREFGIKRLMKNFSADYPVKLLQNADGDYISEQLYDLYSDPEQLKKAFEQFLEMYEEPICTGLEGYASSTGKDVESLTDEEINFVIEKVADVINEELVKVMMLGQQVPEIYNIGKKNPAEEDYYIDDKGNQVYSWDYLNFRDKWTRCKTKLGEVLSFTEAEKELNKNKQSETGSEEDEPIESRFTESVFTHENEADEKEYRLLCDAFVKTLSGVELELFYMCEADLTRAEMAKRLHYESPGTVSKRIKKIQKKLETFLGSVEKSVS